MPKYRRMTQEDRIRLKSYLEVGLSQRTIGDKLGFNKSTISRELKRNTGGRGYRFKQAEQFARERQSFRKERRVLTPKLSRQIKNLLELKWSPEQISKRLQKEQNISVCPETIYRFVYDDYKEGGRLFSFLRFSHRRRRPRFPRSNKDRRGVIQGAVSIEKRGSGANNRSRKGHWERDTMLGKNRSNAILMAADRKTRFVKLAKLENRCAHRVTKATKRILKLLPQKSITNDRGQEFSDHKRLERTLKIPVYFCHPYSSSERGTVENRIGILRQYFPKGCDLSHVTNSMLRKIESQINNRPMRCLDWRTPHEVMFGVSVALTM